MTFLIGCGAGFSGDRTDAGLPVVETIIDRGHPGAIMFETLGERTLALGHVARRADPGLGCEPLLRHYLEPVLRPCVEHGITITGNFGAANPRAALAVVREIARDLSLPSLNVALVHGDDLTDGFDPAEHLLWDGDLATPPSGAQVISANVYIGAQPIAAAIRDGAQVVITGRTADPSLALGPLIAHYGWSWDDFDRLASGTLAGHLLECGAQVTGGYFADPGRKEVPFPEDIGFPIAEVGEDGSFVVTKAESRGGLVDLRTVKEQLLYEIHDPAAYVTPDVVLDITGVELEEVGRNRVRVTGARGRPPPERLKATVGIAGDWLGEGEISYAGPNAHARARLAGDILAARLGRLAAPMRRRIDLIGIESVFDSDDGALGRNSDLDTRDVRVRLAVSAASQDIVAAALREVGALYCCGPAAGGGIRTRMQQRINTASYLVDRNRVRPGYTMERT